MIATISPASTEKLTPRRAWTSTRPHDEGADG
jgi:hypothetical protein